MKHYAVAVGGLIAALGTSYGAIAADTEAAEAEIRMMDMDRDGKLSATEHVNGSKRMFGKMDVNGDGTVTAAEMDAAQAAMPPDPNARAMSSQDKIKAIDTNKDGSLSAEEHATGAKTMFEKMDKDKDGFLTVAELQKGRDAMLGRKARP
jgi:Ca2+-binding EF-hand superfamily protein